MVKIGYYNNGQNFIKSLISEYNYYSFYEIDNINDSLSPNKQILYSKESHKIQNDIYILKLKLAKIIHSSKQLTNYINRFYIFTNFFIFKFKKNLKLIYRNVSIWFDNQFYRRARTD